MDRNADVLVFALSKFISIPSISSSPDHREHCRQASIWFTKCLAQLGASSKTVRTVPSSLAQFISCGALSQQMDRIKIALRGRRGGAQSGRIRVLPGGANWPSEAAHSLLRVSTVVDSASRYQD